MQMNRTERRKAARFALSYGSSLVRAARITRLPPRTVWNIAFGMLRQQGRMHRKVARLIVEGEVDFMRVMHLL